jgi:ribosomal protein L37AE/L43A
MAEIIEFPQETYSYACADCETDEVKCFTDGDIMCNNCGNIFQGVIVVKVEAPDVL